jgi:hypothetical protein
LLARLLPELLLQPVPILLACARHAIAAGWSERRRYVRSSAQRPRWRLTVGRATRVGAVCCDTGRLLIYCQQRR